MKALNEAEAARAAAIKKQEVTESRYDELRWTELLEGLSAYADLGGGHRRRVCDDGGVDQHA